MDTPTVPITMSKKGESGYDTYYFSNKILSNIQTKLSMPERWGILSYQEIEEVLLSMKRCGYIKVTK